MRVSELYAPSGPFVGHDFYLVGPGPSMAVFPTQWLEGRTCILLNDAQRYFPTLGPIALSNERGFFKPLSPCIRYRIVKGRMKHEGGAERPDNHVHWDDPGIHVFSYRSLEWDQTDSLDIKNLWTEPDYYWIGGTVACYAIQFAAQAGARSITMVGCDCGPLSGRNYHNREVLKTRKPQSRAILKSLGRRGVKPPTDINQFVRDYAMYREATSTLARHVWLRFKIPVVSMIPFVGALPYGDQFLEAQRSRIGVTMQVEPEPESV